ncbi:hypothetical protein HEP81_00501 [Streptomyces griseofuscus]|uniref:Uncharacterized protein n=1 Tax=Streptomyces griseofuscus TaxID=146922 RepID=A0A7H1PS07_9ACTN|nr:hypothetical protein [Streptomyces griseofuscus]QNT90837.1 hypothetical protein HEP81_00501 [Streptomyces griseofuscus]
MESGREQTDGLGELVRVYRGTLPRRPLQVMTVAVICFVVECVVWSKQSADASLVVTLVVTFAVLAVSLAFMVRHTGMRIDLYEEGFRIGRRGGRARVHTWPEIASVGTVHVEVSINFSRSHDYFKTVIVPYTGRRIRVEAKNFFASEPGASLGDVLFRGAARGSAESFITVASQRVGAALGQRHLAELRAGGELGLGPLTFTRAGMTLAPFTETVEWSRIEFVRAAPRHGVDLRVAGLPALVGGRALAPRATKAGYSTEGDLLTVFSLHLRPGTDYIALRTVVEEGGTAAE